MIFVVDSGHIADRTAADVIEDAVQNMGGEREGGVERVRMQQARERLSSARDGERPMPHPAPVVNEARL